MPTPGIAPPRIRRASYKEQTRCSPALRRGVATLLIAAPAAACAPPPLPQAAPEPATACSAPSPLDIARAAAYFEEADQISRKDGGRLWGVPLAGPMLFVDAATRAAVANVPDAEGRLAACGGVYVGVLPRDQIVANTAIEWGGQRWTMLLWPLPENGVDRRRLLAHEMFHRIQPVLGIPMKDPPSPHLETAAGRAWLRLEWRALSQALLASGEQRRHAIADALSFREHRHSLFPGAAAVERALELNEGLGEYTGAQLSGLSGRQLAEWAAERLRSFERRESLVRSFAYASGPAYGILLDAARPGWRESVSEDSDLGALLGDASDIRIVRAPEVEQRGVVYGSRSVLQEEAQRAEVLAARLADLRSRFVDGPRLLLPMAGSVSMSFDPSGAATIEGKGTVYETAEVSDAWGHLVVEEGGVLFLQRDGGFTGIVVPVPEGAGPPALQGAGWRLVLTPEWRIEPGSRIGEWVVARGHR